jgi:PAS domain S-box-containing protein
VTDPAAASGPSDGGLSQSGLSQSGLSEGSIHRLWHLAENAWDVIYRYRVAPAPAFEYISPSVIRFNGYSPEEHYADPDLVWRIVDPDDRVLIERMLRQPANAASDPITVRFRHRDGRTVWTEHHITPVHDERGAIVAVEGIMRDVTDRMVAYQTLERRVEERTQELERRRRAAEMLRDLLAVLNSNRALNEILDAMLLQAGQVLGAEGVAIWRLRADGAVLTIQVARGLAPDFVAGVTIPVGHGVVGRAAQERRPIAARNALDAVLGDASVANDPLQRELLERNFARYHSILAAPIVVKDDVYGGLVLYYPRAREFSDEEVALAVMLCDHAALAIENARLRAQAEEMAAAAERGRIARELHDAVTQTLFSASLIAEVLPRLWDRNADEARRRLDELRRLTKGALAEMRTLLLELRPSALVDVPLRDLLRQLADAHSGRTLVPIALFVEGDRPLPPDVNVAMYRVAQEALNNILKHARARRVEITLRQAVEGVELRIKDDGMGFDPGAVPADHFGLRIIRERVESIDATLRVTSQQGHGTEIACIWLAPGEERA